MNILPCLPPGQVKVHNFWLYHQLCSRRIVFPLGATFQEGGQILTIHGESTKCVEGPFGGCFPKLLYKSALVWVTVCKLLFRSG